MRRRIEKLERLLPVKPDPDAPLTKADIDSLNAIHKIYGDGGEPPDWRTVYPRRADLDRDFEEAIATVYGRDRGTEDDERVIPRIS